MFKCFVQPPNVYRCLRTACLLTAVVAHLGESCFASNEISDAIGDATGIHDIASIITELNGSELVFTINFVDPIAPPFDGLTNSVQAFIDLDVDRDPTTGAESQYSKHLGGSGLGAEYFIDSLDFTPGLAEIVDAETVMSIATAPISYTDRSFTITVALADIGGSGLLNYAVIVGPLNTTSPSDGALGSTEIPEPSLISFLVLVAICSSNTIRLRRCR